MARVRWQAGPPQVRSNGAALPPLVVVCEDQIPGGISLAELCRSLGVRVETMTATARLFEFLHYMQPKAVISSMVLSDHDGFDVMKIVAAYNRELPVLLVTDDPVLSGAIDAIEEIWQLTTVWRLEGLPTVARLSEFLYRAGVNTEDPADLFEPIGQDAFEDDFVPAAAAE